MTWKEKTHLRYNVNKRWLERLRGQTKMSEVGAKLKIDVQVNTRLNEESKLWDRSRCNLRCYGFKSLTKLESYLSWKNFNYILVWNANTNYKTSIESFTASNRGSSLLDHVLIRFIFLWTHPRPAHELAVHLVHIVQLDQCIRLLVRLVQMV